jgi:hypothetical protein
MPSAKLTTANQLKRVSFLKEAGRQIKPTRAIGTRWSVLAVKLGKLCRGGSAPFLVRRSHISSAVQLPQISADKDSPFQEQLETQMQGLARVLSERYASSGFHSDDLDFPEHGCFGEAVWH